MAGWETLCASQQIGGLGHVAIQYAIAMGLKVVAVDVAHDKLALAIGGAHAALVTAVSPAAFAQAIGMLRRGGTCVFVGLPSGEFPAPIFDVVLKRLTLRGSIVGTRMDLQEALQFAADGKIVVEKAMQPLSSINSVFDSLRAGTVSGRVVLDMTAPIPLEMVKEQVLVGAM